MIGEYSIHPAAELFPMMDGADFDALVQDIREHGQRDPITIVDGAILDGRNRYRACLQIGVQPLAIEWDARGTPEEFVASMNLHRRHLTVSQRAMIAARLTQDRRRDSQGQFCTMDGLSQDKAREVFHISKGTLGNARKVFAEGTEDELAAIDRGEATVDTVAQMIREGVPPAERAARRRGEKTHPGISARNERIRQDTLLWQNLKGALVAVNNLPKPEDMVSLVQRWDRSRLTDTHLLRALNWLTEFADAWTKGSTNGSARNDRNAA